MIEQSSSLLHTPPLGWMIRSFSGRVENPRGHHEPRGRLCSASRFSDGFTAQIEDIEVQLMDGLDISAFDEDALSLICTSTYGSGQRPQRRPPALRLAGHPGQVPGPRALQLGGTRTYLNTFAFGGKKFNERLQGLGAQRIGEVSFRRQRGRCPRSWALPGAASGFHERWPWSRLTPEGSIHASQSRADHRSHPPQVPRPARLQRLARPAGAQQRRALRQGRIHRCLNRRADHVRRADGPGAWLRHALRSQGFEPESG